MVTVPALFALTLPFESTVAICSLEELHVTFLFDAFDGATVALSFAVREVPRSIDIEEPSLIVTDSTGIVSMTPPAAPMRASGAEYESSSDFS